MDAQVPAHMLPSSTTDDEFLLREGLELLANYRAIADDLVRLSIRNLIASLSENARWS